MTAQIKAHNGTPTLFLDGTPTFYGLMWGNPPGLDEYPLKECARYFSEAGIHLFTFDMGTGGNPPDWCGPGPGRPEHWDFSALERRFGRILEVDPEARFHLRVHLEMPEWWQRLYPEECELTSDGRRLCQSFASKVWREQAKAYLKALVAHLQSIGLADRVIAYQTGAGGTGEWVKATAMAGFCGDYSRPMQEHFRAWLRQRYRDDVNALRAAWNAPGVTFDTAEVPPAAAQLHTTHFTFRDPRREQSVIDYYRCLAELCADLVIDFNRTVKEATEGKALAGAFFGYLMELAWNSGFFAEGADSEYSSYQRSGHLGLRRVLESPYVDFVVSPYSYGFRGIGGDGPSMLPSESVRLHGKIYIYEEDSRTHITCHDHPNYGKADTLEESIAILQRNFAYVVTHGHGIWWLAGWGPLAPHVELSQQPAFRPLLRRFRDIAIFALQLDRKPCAEIAVLLDDESFFYESVRNELDLPLIFQQRLWGLPKMGAPFDTYLLQDFIEGRLPPYKLYIFLNPFYLDRARREALKQELRRDGRVALWIYAPGYIQEEPSLANMSDLTGFSFGKGDHPWGPLMHITNFNHPITQGLPQDLFWGTNSRLGPIFHLEPYGATILGNVVYSQGRCRPGFGVRVFPEWTSVYVAAPNIPAPVLRGIARYAGVHIYSEAGDVLYAAPQLLGVHTLAGGERVFKLPKRVEVVYDLFAGKIIAQDAGQFQVTLPPASTALYYTGDRDLLRVWESIPEKG
ncbi:MAG: beta-galactosidase [Anaerolineae bacterium]|nr:beta-galactosidase [Anaerolineae bacterium]MDW8098072.1 beta-galactosidase [Anaerolineae bacterium]